MRHKCYLQLQIAIDPVMQKGSGNRPPMMPQVLSAQIRSNPSQSLTAAWSSEFWVDAFDSEGETFEDAAAKLVRMVRQAPHLYWIYSILSDRDKGFR